jgi:hypothetical protein
MKSPNYTPVIIIGASCSGAVVLKKCLSRIQGFGIFPNEINFIWCHGNTELNTDELEPYHVGINTKRFIRERFKELVQDNNLNYLVEKTAANSLRVPFVYEVFPEAKFIFIVRDGRDAIASVLKQWHRNTSFNYIRDKEKKKSFNELLPYFGLLLKEKIKKWFYPKLEYKILGPRFNGIDELNERFSIEEICAMQWKLSVEKAKYAFMEMPSSSVYKLHYEQLVTDPENSVMSILKYLGIKLAASDVREIVKDVHPHSIGKWRKNLSSEVIENITPIIKDLLISENYIREKTSV